MFNSKYKANDLTELQNSNSSLDKGKITKTIVYLTFFFGLNCKKTNEDSFSLEQKENPKHINHKLMQFSDQTSNAK